jgi:lysozyme
MGRQFEISNMGLKLIKAYEGYRPVDRTLVSGQRVVGYGHRLSSEEAVILTKPEAEELLKDDLAPFIDMINENVHAPLSQSQFDALVSFAYNIGPKAFLKSDTLRALNNGRPLDAANGFDIWRKSEMLLMR